MAAVFFGEREIEADGLGVADVQIAVRLRRKARMHAAAVFAGSQIPGNHLADETGRFKAAYHRLPPFSS